MCFRRSCWYVFAKIKLIQNNIIFFSENSIVLCVSPPLSVSVYRIFYEIWQFCKTLCLYLRHFFLFITLIVFLSDQLINWDSGVPLNSATNKFGTPWIKNYIKNRFLNLLARYRKYIHILSNIWFTNHVCTLFIRYLFNTIFKLFLYCHFSSDTLQLMFVNSKYWGLL